MKLIANIEMKKGPSGFSIDESLEFRNDIINITSIFEQRLSQGTRHIIHMEAYIVRLIYLFMNKDKKNQLYNLDVLEI